MIYKTGTKKCLDDCWNQINYGIHETKLKNARPIIKSFQINALGHHLSTKSKKEQIAEDRFTEIERANRILLEKMSNIFQEKPAYKVQIIPGRSLNIKRRKTQMEKIMTENNVPLSPGHVAQTARHSITLL